MALFTAGPLEVDSHLLVQGRSQRRLIEAANRADGVIDRMTARATGITKDVIHSAVRSGLLEQVHPGVWRIPAGPATRRQQMRAALMWAGPGSTLSHWSALEIHGLDLTRTRLHVSTPRSLRCRTEVLRVHDRLNIRASDVEQIDGLKTTVPERTLVDMALLAAPLEWETVLDAFLRRDLDLNQFTDYFLTMAVQGRNGVRLIRRALEARRFEEGVPEQLFERKLLGVLRAAGLSLPVSQHPLVAGGKQIRLDFAYPERHIAIEAQSYRWHSDRSSWERERARLGDLASLGWLVIEVTWRQLVNDPQAVAARIRGALSLRPPAVA